MAGYWAKFGCLSFGGVAGQLALLEADLVARLRWVERGAYARGLAFCMTLPGPEVQQLAIYLGWRLHGVAGGLLAGTLFILPGAVLMMALAWLTAARGDSPLLGALFAGVMPVVVAIVVMAVWRMGRGALRQPADLAIAAGAFAGLFVGVPFILLIAAAALLGWLTKRGGHPGGGERAAELLAGPRPLLRLAAYALGLALGLLLPLAGLILAFGPAAPVDIAGVFTAAAFVTFGGAYAVLPFIAEAGVNAQGWLSTEQMARGLALAESTPGPTILVVQFVGFFAGWTEPMRASPAASAILASCLALWCTFLPGYVLVLAGAPHVEAIAGNRHAAAALAGISAAVVGLIANLAVFLAQAALIDTDRPDWIALPGAALAGIALSRGVASHWVVLAGAVLGLASLEPNPI